MAKLQQINKASLISIIVAVVITGGGVAACSDNESSTTDSGNESSTAVSSDISAEESTTPAEAASLPDGYPEDAAPIYQPSTTTIGMEMGEGWIVTIESDDDIEDIADSILDTYESMGAKVTQTPFDDEGAGQVAGGNAGYGIIITYDSDTDKNVSSITYHVEPQIER